MKIVVLEYQKIYISHNRDLSKFRISKEDSEILRKFDIENNGIFKWGNNYVCPQQWIGVISLPEFSIEILPKINDSTIDNIRSLLIQMIKVAYDIPIKNNIFSSIDFSKNGLLELFISDFIKKVKQYIELGLVNLYNRNISNLKSIKGTIDFSKQINKNCMNPTRFVCRYSKLDFNNNINQIIKFTIFEMMKISNDNLNLRKLKDLTMYFNGVSLITVDKAKTFNIKVDRNNLRVKEVIDYCNFFLNNMGVSLISGEKKVLSILFDMNKLFEKFIYKNYKRLLGTKVSYQYNNYYLLENEVTKNKKIRLIPDMIINKENKKIIIDTKWKVVKNFISQTDAYQMNAYASSINKVESVILLYPNTPWLKINKNSYKFIGTTNQKDLKIRGIDLLLINNKKEFDKYLLDIIN